jgi:hypothetical protein
MRTLTCGNRCHRVDVFLPFHNGNNAGNGSATKHTIIAARGSPPVCIQLFIDTGAVYILAVSCAHPVFTQTIACNKKSDARKVRRYKNGFCEHA